MYWDNPNSNTLKVSDIGNYVNFPHMTSTVPEGYNCDPLQPTPILFLGSCDLDGPIDDTNKSWARMLHCSLSEKYGPIPYIALAKMTAGFMSMPRRLLTFCEKFGAPKQVFAVIPRPVSIEVPLLNGEIVSVSNREGFAHYLKKHKRVNELDYDLLIAASSFATSQFKNEFYQLYQFEQSATFLKLICQCYEIEFNWTLNLSSSAIPYYEKFFTTFMENCSFMNSTFRGLGLAKDFSFDGSMGNQSQYEIFKVFSSKQRRTEDTLSILDLNLKTAKAKTDVTQWAMS